MVNKNLSLQYVKSLKLSDIFYTEEIESMIKLCKDAGYDSIEELLAGYLVDDLRMKSKILKYKGDISNE